MKKKIPTSIFGRSAALLKMASKVGIEELKTKVNDLNVKEKLETQTKQALTIVETLGRMKGAAMKVGQLLSLDSADILPNEIKAYFEPLQNSTPFHIPFEKVTEILQNEFPGQFDEIKNLSNKPFAAASIGQVHSATFRGQEIAIKIQYPGIAKTIDSDLSVLKKCLNTALFVKRKKIQIDTLLDELSENLHREVDYYIEKENLEKYQKNLPENELWSYPTTIDDLCSRCVISFEKINAPTITEWLKTNPKQEAREKIARAMIKLYIKEFYQFGFVQTDPNPSNFFVDPEQIKLILIDFGSVKSYDKEFIVTYRKLVQLIRSGDRPEYLKLAYNFDLLSPRENPQTKDVFCEMMEQSLDYFSPEKQPFDFSDLEHLDKSKELTKKFLNSVEHSKPPSHLFLLHRKLGGLYFILRELNARIDLSESLENAFAIEI